jgi:NAD(P)-dependent dehydrogenase (short-subunit alcohol dehydrogenase family)
MEKKVALVTHALDYAGPGAAGALAAAGFLVICHDPAFQSGSELEEFEKNFPEYITCRAATSVEAIDFAVARFDRLDCVVSNDIFPALWSPIDQIDIDEFRETIEGLLIEPAILLSKAAATMKAYGRGNIIVVTSAAPLQPEPGYAMYSSARAAASNLARCLAKELGAHGISVNAIAPNFLDSEMYYPAELWKNNASQHDRLKQQVPLGRMGTSEELGELVVLLASGKANFITGQVIPFTGGWGI